MSSRRCTPRSLATSLDRGAAARGAGRCQRGFSLIEMLVAIVLSGMAMALFVRDFGFTVQTRREMDLVIETQQALHATQAFLTQELRQAGACLPANGEFLALSATDGGVIDEVSIRIGVVDRQNLNCLATVLTSDATASDNTLHVQDAAGFDPGQWIYVTRIGGKGKSFRISASGADWIEVAGMLGDDYVTGGGVYGIEERTYAVQTIGGVPVLTLSIDGHVAQPLVAGVEEFDLRYRLDPCPPCAEIDEPSTSAEWRQVREVLLRVVARSTTTKPRGGGYVRVSGTTSIRPRNFI